MERSADDQLFDFPFVEQALLVDLHPGFLVRFIVGIQPARQLPEVLARVIEIDDLNRAGKMLVGQIPDPFGSVAHDDFLFRAAPAAVPGFQIDALAKLLGGLDGAGVGGRIRIANRRKPSLSQAVCVNTHPSLTSRVWAGWPSVLPLRPSVSFFTTGTPVPSICTYRMGIGLTDHDRQIQLDGALDLSLLARGDIGADGLRRALHRFGRSPPGRPAASSARGRDRRAPPGPPSPACGARRERIPCFRCPVRHRRETGRCDSAGIDTRAATRSTSPTAVRTALERNSR